MCVLIMVFLACEVGRRVYVVLRIGMTVRVGLEA